MTHLEAMNQLAERIVRILIVEKMLLQIPQGHRECAKSHKQASGKMCIR